MLDQVLKIRGVNFFKIFMPKANYDPSKDYS